MTDSHEPKSELLRVALDATKKAGRIMMKYYAEDVPVEFKDDMSPVTIADKESEKAIIDTLRAHYPTHRILGEESGESEAESEYTWIIDPIDGTKNFIHHIPLFGSLVALAKGKEIILGVTNIPAMNELLYAEKGHGAYLNDEQIHVSITPKLASAQVSFGGMNYFRRIKKDDAVASIIQKSSRVRSFGDLYAYHLIASGRFDAVIEGPLHIWDFAASGVIIEEAGGRITDFQGKDITTESTTVVASNGLIHKEIIEIMK